MRQNFTNGVKKLLLLVLINFLTLNSNNFQAKTFLKIENIINKNKYLSKNALMTLIKDELVDFIFTGDYKHVLHSLFIQYDYGHRFTKNYNNEYEIKKINLLRMLSRNLDDELYFSSSISLINYMVNNNQKIKLLLELKHKFKQTRDVRKFIKIYNALAINYYSQNNFDRAIIYWLKSKRHINRFNILEKSSMLNNISLAYKQKGLLVKATYFNNLAQVELNKLKSKNFEELCFQYNLYTNQAGFSAQLGENKKAISLYKSVLNFFLSNETVQIYAAEIVTELMKLNEIRETQALYNISKIEQIFKKNKINKKFNDLESENLHLELFINYYTKENNYLKLSYYYKLYLKNITLLNNQKIEKIELINEQIEKDNIRITNEKNEINLLNQQTKIKNFYVVFLFVAMLFIIIILFIIKNYKHKTQLQKHKNELVQLSQKAIENELKFQKESNLHLQLNLDIKQKSEQVFMEKLKEIRRKKHNDPEEIIKELQLQIINLLQIDKKNKNKTKEKSSEDNSFTISLIELNKNLSEQELRLCTYFKMNLSTKEISQLEQHLAPASIRVLKNRIKKKLELGPEDNLNQFLNSLV
jgi:hypothetical protein